MNAIQRRLARMPGPEKVHLRIEPWDRGWVARGTVEGSAPYRVNIHFAAGGKVVETLCECPDGCAHEMPRRPDVMRDPYFRNRFGLHRACKHILAAIGVAKKMIRAEGLKRARTPVYNWMGSVMASDAADHEIALAMGRGV